MFKVIRSYDHLWFDNSITMAVITCLKLFWFCLLSSSMCSYDVVGKEQWLQIFTLSLRFSVMSGQLFRMAVSNFMSYFTHVYSLFICFNLVVWTTCAAFTEAAITESSSSPLKWQTVLGHGVHFFTFLEWELSTKNSSFTMKLFFVILKMSFWKSGYAENSLPLPS